MADLFLGKKFSSFIEFEKSLAELENSTFVKFYKRDSRKLESIRHKVKHEINPALVYYEIKYHCIWGGPLRLKGTGKRRTSTFKIDCPAHITLRVSSDGNTLDVKSFTLCHNHETSKVVYDHLPQQRRLPEDVKEKAKMLLSLKVDKRLLQEELQRETGKIVTLRDLSNLKKKSSNKAYDTVNILQENFAKLKKRNSSDEAYDAVHILQETFNISSPVVDITTSPFSPSSSKRKRDDYESSTVAKEECDKEKDEIDSFLPFLGKLLHKIPQERQTGVIQKILYMTFEEINKS